LETTLRLSEVQHECKQDQKQKAQNKSYNNSFILWWENVAAMMTGLRTAFNFLATAGTFSRRYDDRYNECHDDLHGLALAA